MRSAVERQSEEAEKVVRDIRRATRRQYSAEEKVRIVIAGLRAARTASPSCAARKASTRISIIAGPRSFGGGQEAASRRYRTGSNQRRSQRAADRSAAAQGVAGRGPARKSLAQKKRDRRWGVRYMRYRAAEKLEIIHLVEQSSLPVRRTLAQLGISRLLPLVSAVSSARRGSSGRRPASRFLPASRNSFDQR